MIIPILFSCFIFVSGANPGKTLQQNIIELNGKKVSAPANMNEIKKKAKKIYLNDKNFLEAEFRYGIVMVYIPHGKFTMGTAHGEEKELRDLSRPAGTSNLNAVRNH